MTELTEKYNRLYREAMNPNLDDHQVRHKIEQHKGIAYAMTLMDELERAVIDEIESRKLYGEGSEE